MLLLFRFGNLYQIIQHIIFALSCVCLCVCVYVYSVVSNSLVTPWTVVYQASLPMDFPGKNTEVGCCFLLTYETVNAILKCLHSSVMK